MRRRLERRLPVPVPVPVSVPVTVMLLAIRARAPQASMWRKPRARRRSIIILIITDSDAGDISRGGKSGLSQSCSLGLSNTDVQDSLRFDVTLRSGQSPILLHRVVG